MKEQEGILYLFALLHLSVNLSSDTVQTLPTYVYTVSYTHLTLPTKLEV